MGDASARRRASSGLHLAGHLYRRYVRPVRFDRLDLNLLVALDMLIETENVTETARRLNISQPTVTGALNRLRDYFEDDLLVQRGRRMFLTRKAQELAEPVRQSLLLIRGKITRPGPFDPATAHRHFVVVASDYALTTVVADAISAVARTAPHVTFDVRTPGSYAEAQFHRAAVDLFLNVSAFRFPDHPYVELWSDDEVIISSVDAGYGAIDADTFFAAGHAVALFEPERRSAVDAFIHEQGRERRVELVLPTSSALPQAIVGTRRLATMHRIYAERFAKSHPIKLHETWTRFPEIVEVAQWHQARNRDPGVQWLVGLLPKTIQRRAMPPDMIY